MKLLRLGAVLMFATAATFACTDDDDGSPEPMAGGASDGGEPSKAGGNSGGNAGESGSAVGGAEPGGAANLGGAGGEAQGGAGGQAQGGEAQGGAGGQAQGGEAQGGAGGEGPACVNQFDDGAGGAGGEPGGSFELAGAYDDNYGSSHVITNELWNDSGVIEYDGDANVVYLQGACDAQYGANEFSKVVYTEPSSGSFYFCMIDFNLPTLAAAKASTKTADDSAPDTSGCGAFPWTKATAP